MSPQNFWTSSLRENKSTQNSCEKNSNSNKFHVWIKKSNNIKEVLLILWWTEIKHCNANAILTKKLSVFERLNDESSDDEL